MEHFIGANKARAVLATPLYVALTDFTQLECFRGTSAPIIFHWDRQGKGEHPGKVHRPDTNAHCRGSAGEPPQPSLAARGCHAVRKIKASIGFGNRDQGLRVRPEVRRMSRSSHSWRRSSRRTSIGCFRKTPNAMAIIRSLNTYDIDLERAANRKLAIAYPPDGDCA